MLDGTAVIAPLEFESAEVVPTHARPRVLVANAGTIRVFQVARQLHRHGLLQRCATTIHVPQALLQRLPAGIRWRLDRATTNRQAKEIDHLVWTYSWPELAHLVAVRFFPAKANELIKWRNQRFGRQAAKSLLKDVDLVWSFDTASHDLFEAAKERGIRCILDVCIAHPKLGHDILVRNAKLRPQFAADLDLELDLDFLAMRQRELELADQIMVGSAFVANSLIASGISAAKIAINPYGVDLETFVNQEPTAKRGNSSMTFLFVGSFTQRKGIYDLIEAWERSQLGQSGAKLILVGGTRSQLSLWKSELPAGIEIRGRMAHTDIAHVFRSADAFVFPSFYEGFAKVILEAMASGLPVITTHNSCDSNIVAHNHNGFVIEPGDVDELANAMKAMHSQPELRREFASRSVDIASHYSWQAYGDRCAAVCHQVMRQDLQIDR